MMPSIVAASIFMGVALPYKLSHASAAGLEIPDLPLVVSRGTTVKPNVAVIFDDSHSMAAQHMPGRDDDDEEEVCWGWYKYNVLAYNPNFRYVPPYKPDGAPYSGNVLYPDNLPRYPDAINLAALRSAYQLNPNNVQLRPLKDGYFPAGERTFIAGGYSNSTGNLNRPPFGDDNLDDDDDLDDEEDWDDDWDDDDDDDDDENFYYTVPRNASADPRGCLDDEDDRGGVDELEEEDFILVRDKRYIAAPGVTTGRPEAWVNYANWYSYYRRRAYTMKAALGEAFKDVDESYRVGLYYINSHRNNSRNTDLPIADFSTQGIDQNPSQVQSWYDTLYGSKRNGGTPLRGALSRIGRMFAGKTADPDPVQYSCQRNFAILATDGYGNAIGERGDDEGEGQYSNYGPFKVDRNEDVGNVDGGDEVKVPFKDKHNQPNTLSDVAYYYYTTDLRTEALQNCTREGEPELNLCTNNVPGSSQDKNNQQHMATHAMGFGIGGDLLYESNYEKAPDISDKKQYFDIVQPNGIAWPRIGEEEDDGNGSEEEGEDPYGEDDEEVDPAKIDDVWHAAVNGRGRYYSVTDPASLYQGIRSALSGMPTMRGAESPAATSSLRLNEGDNTVFVAYYDSTNWHGDVEALSFNFTTGEASDDPIWSAKEQLKEKLESNTPSRNIWFLKNPLAKTLDSFDLTNLQTAGLHTHFADLCSKTPQPAQCADWLSGDSRLTRANTAANLINYLRGESNLEDSVDNVANDRLYRARDSALGDIVHGAPVYVKEPRFRYNDPTYNAFKTAQANRAANLYVAANDGMLHAFDATTGDERWAYVPRFVMPNIWMLADRNYAHRYFVDGAPVVADICIEQSADNPQLCASEAKWKTILVGGLNKGGCGYYALDITDPNTPVGMWEFTDDDLGYSYGNPVIAKNKAGKWVVMFTSGYNNHTGDGSCNNTGDGNGHVFVLDASSGSILTDDNGAVIGKISLSGHDSASAPVGLGKLNAWIDDLSNPVAKRLYAGDLNGKLWRIDFDDNHGASGREATLLAHLKDASGSPQPITTRPELIFLRAVGPNGTVVVTVGTGKLLEQSDLDDTAQQSLYAIKDTLGATGITNARDETRMVGLTLQETTATSGPLSGRVIRKVSGGPVNWVEHDGWYLDFNPGNSSPGERVNVDMEFHSGILTLVTNVPETDSCGVGGYSFYYFFDVQHGRHARNATADMVGVLSRKDGMNVGIDVVELPSGAKHVHGRKPDGGLEREEVQGEDPATRFRRAAWRELTH